MFGDEDRVLNRYGRMSLIGPIMPVVESAQQRKVQPLSPIDFADGILAALTKQNAIGQTYLHIERTFLNYDYFNK